MLYDNALLARSYLEGHQVTSDAFFRRVAVETLDYVLRDMTAPEGGFYSSTDADSEGEEGKFFVWTPESIAAVLDEEEARRFNAYYDISPGGNWERGLSIPHTPQPLAAVAERLGIAPDELERSLETARAKVYEARERRVKPGLDDKILTAWNGLMIKGLAAAAIRFGREDYLAAAQRALDFIRERMWREGRLLATCKDGRAHLNAYLDDYAFLMDAILTLLSARWCRRRLDFALRLAHCLLENFHDKAHGGFFFTAHDHEALIQRRKDFMDDSLPAGNGIAALALMQLGHLVNEPRFVEAGEGTLRAAWPAIERMPTAHNAMLLALEEACYPPARIILRGATAEMEAWKKQCLEAAGIRDRVYAIPGDETGLPQALDYRSPENGVAAYICEGFQCLAPVHEAAELVNRLKNMKSG